MSQQSKLFIRILVSISVIAFTLYARIHSINGLTSLRIAIPKMEKEVKDFQKKNERLRYEIDRFESPIHLIELANKPEFGHLKHPRLDEIIVISEQGEEP